MGIKNSLRSAIVATGLSMLLFTWVVTRPDAQPAPPSVQIDADDIGGVVRGKNGPEAGVWVIALTTELGTRFAKMVVTDDRGRYVVPDLPQATYEVWVRGYGLVDSPKVRSARGQIVNLTAVPAPSAKAAAEYYPAIYWFSMLRIPDRSLFPGTGVDGNGMPANYKTQEQWLNAVQLNGCGNCHQLGDKATREIPESLGTFEKSVDAWQRRLLSGPGATSMAQFIALMNTADGGHIRRLAEWTDRVKAGEIPASVPPRPHGVERNLVVTVYDWLLPKYYLHDLTTTDRRKPTVNSYGLIYGATELSTDDQPVFDPVKITKSLLKVPVRDEDVPSSALANKVGAPSPYFGTEQVWDSRVNAHNPMMDHEGRVYYTAQSRSPKHPPAYCAAASNHPSAKVYPLTRTPDGFVQNSRQVTVYDPRTKQFTFIDTCFGTHHLNFGEDANDTLWLSNNLQNPGPARLGEHEDVLGDARRGEVTGMDPADRGHQRQRQARRLGRAWSARGPGQGQAARPRALRNRAESGRRLDLGIEHQPSWLGHSRRARPEPERDGAGGSVQGPGSRLRHARLRHRSEGRGVGDVGERPHSELRSQEVQGPPQ